MIKKNIREHNRDNIRGRKINFRRYLAKAIGISALSLLLSIVSLRGLGKFKPSWKPLKEPRCYRTREFVETLRVHNA